MADSRETEPATEPQVNSPVSESISETVPAPTVPVPSTDATSADAPPSPTETSESAIPINAGTPEPVEAADGSETGASVEDAVSEAMAEQKVKIGRQDGGPAPKRRHEPRPNIAETPRSERTEPIEAPSKRDDLDGDLQAEFDAMFDEGAVDDLMGSQAISEAASKTIELDSRVHGEVTRITGEDVFISLGGPNEGIAPLKQFKTPPEVGQNVEMVVAKYNREDGYYELIVPGAAMSVGDWSDIDEGALVEARITGSNTGGLECMVNQIPGFIPASQIAIHRVEDFSDYHDQKLPCIVTEANPNRKNLVLSHRSVLEREQEEKRVELMQSLAVGDIRDGVVRRIQDFGAFVDIGGIDGLIHISQLSWDRVNHPSDVLTEGESIQVKVEKIDPETGKIGLSYRALQAHPWDDVEQEYPVGTTQSGTVTKIANFGAFVRLGPGVEGLIHISELAHHRVVRVDTMVKEGQEVEVKILDVDAEKQRMSLSLKALVQAPADNKKKVEEEEEVPAEPRIKHDGPLKGGTDRPSGGDSFGLKW